MKYLYCFLFVCMISACWQTSGSSWQTIDYKVFKLKAPPGWKKVKFRGIDSFVGGLSDGKDTLTFDYGPYSPEVDLDSSGAYMQDTINGLSALIGISGDADSSAAMEVYLKDKETKFFISGHRLSDILTVLKIFKTIYFPEGDSTINTPLVMEKFRSGPLESGRLLYQMNCASCHNRSKKLTGPPFADILPYRDEKWIYRFLTDRASVKADSLTAAFRKETGDIDCTLFPALSEREVNQILNYVK